MSNKLPFYWTSYEKIAIETSDITGKNLFVFEVQMQMESKLIEDFLVEVAVKLCV